MSLNATWSMLRLLRFGVRFSPTILPHSLQRRILTCPSNKCNQIYQPDTITELEPNKISSSHNDIAWDLLCACDSLLAVFLSIILYRHYAPSVDVGCPLLQGVVSPAARGGVPAQGPISHLPVPRLWIR